MTFPTLEEVVQDLRVIAEDDTISADSKLTELDVDSLDVLEWIFEIEGRAEISIDESLYEQGALERTIREFYERIKQSASA
jgi:acyl carrier protein